MILECLFNLLIITKNDHRESNCRHNSISQSEVVNYDQLRLMRPKEHWLVVKPIRAWQQFGATNFIKRYFFIKVF